MTKQKRPSKHTSPASHLHRITLGAFSLLALNQPVIHAQDVTPLPDAPSALTHQSNFDLASTTAPTAPARSSSLFPLESSDPLPQAPSTQATGYGQTSAAAGAQHVAPRDSKYIPAGWTAQPLSVELKAVIGARDLYSFSNFGAMFVSAGYSQVVNGQPNYGAGGRAFGQRLGAAAIRETSQGVFTDIVFSSLLHEDPRYYQLGPEHNFVNRTMYAITRPLIARSDNGHRTINGGLLLGYAAAAGLNTTFYPSSNRNFHDVASSWAGSIGGAALGFFVSEFTTDTLQALHLKKAP